MDNNETQANIIAEMRNRADTVIEGRVITARNFVPQETVEDWADRLEAAAKREKAEAVTIAATNAVNLTNEKWLRDIGNCTAMREALLKASYFLRELNMGAVRAPDGETPIFCWEVADIVDAALAEPPRNCDVGTVDEQTERYHNFTGRHNPCAYNGNARCAEDCPVHIMLTQEGLGELVCQLEWAQMPYEKTEEGDEDGSK